MRFALLVALVFGTASASAQTMDMKPTKAPSDPGAYGAEVKDGYTRVRAATSPFKDLRLAVAAGYAATVAACLADPKLGGMGYHHVNRGQMDRTLEVERPEILLYERREDGSYVLNGVEYIVPYSAWPADSAPPRIMGRELARSDELKLWYMHMWAWTQNPAGLFANYHPGVRCRTPPA